MASPPPVGNGPPMVRPLVLALALAMGCSKSPPEDSTPGTLPKSCDDGAALDTYVAGIEKITTDGTVVRIADASPAPPDVGVNSFVVEVDGKSGSEVKVRPWMPLHGHGTVPEWYVGTETAGSWELGGVDLFMAGLWELTVTVDSDDPATGALFRFCLEG